MADKKRITILVKPHSKDSRIDFNSSSGMYTAFVKSPPEKGKANKEVLKLVRKRFKERAQIVSGRTNKLKVVELF